MNVVQLGKVHKVSRQIFNHTVHQIVRAICREAWKISGCSMYIVVGFMQFFGAEEVADALEVHIFPSKRRGPHEIIYGIRVEIVLHLTLVLLIVYMKAVGSVFRCGYLLNRFNSCFLDETQMQRHVCLEVLTARTGEHFTLCR